jgi:hypothetical protein
MKKIFLLVFGLIVLVSASANGFGIGDRVMVDWSGDDYWYPGTIINEEEGQYEISFDDFDREWTAAAKIVPENLKAGDRVQSRWLGKTTYYPGTIQERMGNAIYIVYDDGDEEATTVNHVRVTY